MNTSVLIRRSRGLTIAVFVIFSVGCGTDEADRTSSEGRALPVGVALEPTDFATLPKPGSARPVDAPVETETSIAQSFLVPGSSPVAVIDFYVRALPRDSWLPVGEDHVGTTTIRTQWRRGNQLLELIVFSENGVTSAGTTQLDLLLQLE